MNFPHALMFIVGMVLICAGFAVGDFIDQSNSAQRVEHAQHFDTARGQAGFILGAYRHRTAGITMMTVGATLLLLYYITVRWDTSSRRRATNELLPYERDRTKRSS